jgi:subtilisin family serine protease
MNGSGQIHVVYSTSGDRGSSRLVLNKQIGAMPADDVNGHGTGVASITAGWRWNTAEADEGHAPGANIAGYSIANEASSSSSLSTMASAYQAVAADAAAHRIVTTNLSYTGSPNPLSVEQKACDSLTLTADALNCTAAANSGATLTSSLLNLNGLSVGATYPYPWAPNPSLAHTVSSFSCRGLINGSMPFPALCANGVSVFMARRDDEGSNWIASGTSMASPQVCGAATQLRARFTALKANEVKAILLASCLASPGSGATQTATGPGCGYLHNPSAHSIAAAPLRHGVATITKTSLSWSRTLPVVQGVPTQVAIAWHRTNPNSSSWANLNLEVRDGSALVASSANPTSTLEFVRFTPVASASYTIVVSGVKSSIPAPSQGGQPFAWATTTDTQ